MNEKGKKKKKEEEEVSLVVVVVDYAQNRVRHTLVCPLRCHQRKVRALRIALL